MMSLTYWLMLLKIPGVGLKTFYQALRVFESPDAVFASSRQTLLAAKVFRANTIEHILRADTALVEPDLHWASQPDHHLISLIDDQYPESLKQLSDPPPLLYIQGDPGLLAHQQLAIVGSRNPSAGAKQDAYRFAKGLSQQGLIITSGMAMGIDAQAHLGALEAGAPTIAVCGTGLDLVYPPTHRVLAQQIVAQGALVSELPIGSAPLPGNFPKRNRLISALSLGVLVVEASIKSGTLITARLAAEQGREVFALPSSIHNPLARGPHSLIKQGAALVENIEDILNILPSVNRLAQVALDGDNDTKKRRTNASELLKYLSYNAVNIDELVEKSGLSPQVVTQELLSLELDNQIEKTACGYILTR